MIRHKQTHQANRLACGWMSRAVNPFTVCSTLMESGVRGSKNLTSPLTLSGSVKVDRVRSTPALLDFSLWRKIRNVPDTDDLSIRLLLQMSFDHPGAVLPVGHHATVDTHRAVRKPGREQWCRRTRCQTEVSCVHTRGRSKLVWIVRNHRAELETGWTWSTAQEGHLPYVSLCGNM